MSKVSVIIRAFNEAEHIGRLMLGLQAQRLKPHEIILVDSGSNDQTVPLAEHFGAKVVHISKYDFTFGRALNVGCQAATGDILVFVSAHVYPTHDLWLENLISPFDESKVVLAYGKQRGADVNKFSEHQIFAKWFPNQKAFPQAGYFCNNANCAIRKSTWERLRYNEVLTGLEDLDWAKRAQAEGGWLVYVPDAKIIHVHDESWPQVQNRYRREALALRQIDDHASFSLADFARLLVSNIVSDSIQAARSRVLTKEFPSIVRFRFHQLFGTWRGHSGPSDISDALRQRFYFPPDKADHATETDLPDYHLIDYEHLASSTPVGTTPALRVFSSSGDQPSFAKPPPMTRSN